MTTTLGAVRTDVRDRLDEVTARFWTDAELNRWINEAARDVAKRTETLQTLHRTLPALASTSRYTLPNDVVRLHKIEYVPTGQFQTYPLQPATQNQMETVWGLNQGQLGTPRFYVPWGFVPNLEIQVFPVPNLAGTFNLYYYRLPAAMLADSDVVEIPEGWESLIPVYVEFRAKRKDKDPTWADAKAEYEEQLRVMSESLRILHDQQQYITTASGVGVPSWLYEFSD